MKDTDPLAAQAPLPVIVVSEALAGEPAPTGARLMGLDAWRATLVPTGGDLALADMTVLGLCLSTAEVEVVAADPQLARLLEAARIPVRDLGKKPDAAAVARAALELALARLDAALRAAATERAALAELRQGHMQMQTDHAELEAWVWDQLAPRHMLVRSWPATADTLGLTEAPVLQPLPAPSRGFISVDIHLAEAAPAGTVAIRLLRPTGPAFEDLAAEIPVPAGLSGWLRLSLPRAGGGEPEDAVLELAFRPADGAATLQVSLAPRAPFADLCLTADGETLDRPLALRVYRTLPRMPAPVLHDPRLDLPADGITRLVRPSALGTPAQLPYFRRRVRRALRAYPDTTSVDLWEAEDAIRVHPSASRPVVARLPGLTAEGLTQVRGIIQVARHDTMEIAFAIGAVPAGSVASVEEALAHLGQWVHLLPAEWGEVWYEPPAALTGPVDLLLATAMPNMPFNRNADALFHGFRVTSAAR